MKFSSSDMKFPFWKFVVVILVLGLTIISYMIFVAWSRGMFEDWELDWDHLFVMSNNDIGSSVDEPEQADSDTLVVKESDCIANCIDQLVELNWISFALPSIITKPYYDIEMNLLEGVEQIEIHWYHPATGRNSSHILSNFQSGDTTALYRMRPSFGSMLPGKNEYEIIAQKVVRDGEPDVILRAQYSLELDLQNIGEVYPDLISFDSLPDSTDSTELVVSGSAPNDIEKIQFYSYNRDSGKGTFAVLNKYKPGDDSFEYFVKERFDNLLPGLNQYVVEMLNVDNKVVSRRHFSLRSTRLSLSDQVRDLFGDFKMKVGGWYVSEKLPWFSMRPVYESVYYVQDASSVVLPRPTLMYTAESYQDVPLCDYLKNIDYQEDGKSYRAYSFETCSQTRYGVSVFDRFLDVLRYYNVRTVPSIEYKDWSSLASSAFVMIETGGMKESQSSLAFTGGSFSDSNDVEIGRERDPIYFVYQMLLTEQMPYADNVIGNIPEEASEERIDAIERLEAFLSQHEGVALFAAYLESEDPS